MELTATIGLLIATTITGLGAGAPLDRTADLANGEVWYPILGIATTLVTAATAIVGLLTEPRHADRCRAVRHRRQPSRAAGCIGPCRAHGLALTQSPSTWRNQSMV